MRAIWRLLGAFWTPPGLNLELLDASCAELWKLPAPLDLNLFSNWTALGLSTGLQAPFEVLLEIFGGPLEAARAEITNRGSSVLPKGLLSATAVHGQRSSRRRMPRHLDSLKTTFENRLYYPRVCQIKQYFICTTPRAADCDSAALPTKLLVAG